MSNETLWTRERYIRIQNNQDKNILIFSGDLDSNSELSEIVTNPRLRLSLASERKKSSKGPNYEQTFIHAAERSRTTVNKKGCYVVMSVQVILYRSLIYRRVSDFWTSRDKNPFTGLKENAKEKTTIWHPNFLFFADSPFIVPKHPTSSLLEYSGFRKTSRRRK